ncbi:MAG: DUF721 domain-containing protein, partial [Spirochaetaceae bacterium]|nr:DUF721 domain-containing protein [Spirochaetaceae bacterium]
MKSIGELLSGYFSEETLKKAGEHHKLFSSWRAVAGEHIASHSRIVELERAVLFVEADHPGWIQILQTRQNELLNAVRRHFPDLGINAIAFRLSRNAGPANNGYDDALPDETEPDPAHGETRSCAPPRTDAAACQDEAPDFCEG